MVYIENGNIDSSLLIMLEVAKWLTEKGEPLWKIEDLTKEKLLEDNITSDNFYTCWENDEPIATMILQWHYPKFWKNIRSGETGFIRKLCVSRKYAGKGISYKMMEFAENECKRKNINYLRLDCAGDRQKLCKFYESLGYTQINKKIIGEYNIAFYEKYIDKKATTTHNKR